MQQPSSFCDLNDLYLQSPQFFIRWERVDLGIEAFSYNEELIQGNHLGLLPPSDAPPTFPLSVYFLYLSPVGNLDIHLSLLPLGVYFPCL